MVVSFLIQGVDINFTTGFGRTPIMVAVVADRTDIVQLLLDHNANVDICDVNNENAIDIAKKFNNKYGQNTLIEFKWRKRTEESMRKKREEMDTSELSNKDDRFAHQIFDSNQKTWLKGNYAQVYMQQLIPSGEFSGTGFSAPKSVKNKSNLGKALNLSPYSLTFDFFKRFYLWFFLFTS